MSWTVWALLGFTAGWLLHFAWPPAPLLVAPPTPMLSTPFRLWCARISFFCLFLVLSFLAMGHVGHFPAIFGGEQQSLLALAWEEWLVKSRAVWAALWAVAGWLSRDFRAAIGEKLSRLYDAFLGKGHDSPWALQAALAVLILFGTLLFLRPEFLKRMESFRAGEMEAKFTSDNRIRDTKFNMNFSAIHSRETITQWDNFLYFSDQKNKKEEMRESTETSLCQQQLDRQKLPRILII